MNLAAIMLFRGSSEANSQIIAFVSIKYHAESHAEMCGHRPKNPPVADVREKKTQSEHENKQRPEHPKGNKKREELLAQNVQPLQKLQGWSVTGEASWLFP